MILNKKNIVTILLYAGAMGMTSFVPFIMLPILTKELTIAQYGVLALIETSILFMVPLVSLKIEAGIGVQYFKLSQSLYKLYVINALFIALIAFFIVLVLFVVFNKQLSELIGLAPFYVFMLPVFALLRVISAVILSIYRSQQKAGHFFVINAVQAIINLGLSFILVVIFKKGIAGRLEGIYGAYLIVSILGIIFFYNNGFFKKWSPKYFKEIFNYSIPLIPHTISGIIMAMSDRYFLVNYFGAKEVAQYTASYQISAIMLLAGTVINQFWAPQLYSYLRKSLYAEARKMGVTITLILLFLALIIFGIKDYLYMYLVDEKFYPSKLFFVWLLLGFLFQSLNFLVTNYLFFYNKTFLLAKLTITGALINLVLNYILIERFSSVGAAYSTAITWFVLLLMISITMLFNKQQWQAECQF